MDASTFTSIAWPDNPVIQGILGLIGVGFLVGLVLSCRSLSRIKNERTAAGKLIAHKDKEMYLSPETVLLLVHKEKDRLASQLLQSMLDQQGLAFARPSDALEPVLDTVGRLTGPSRTVPNLLLLFGLIGTVVGLAYTLSSLGIKDAIANGNPKLVADSLGTTLKGMSSAFAGTLWGVGAAFFLQLLNAFAGVQAERLAGDLDQVALKFAPAIYPAGNEKQMASLSDLVKRSEQFLAETQSKISETSEKFATVLQEAGGVIHQSLETLNATSKDISKALQQASGDVRQSSQHLTGAVNAIKEHQQDFRNIYVAFSDMFDRSMSALKLHSEGELKEIRALQAAFGNSGSLIVQEIFKSAQRMDQVSQDLARGEAAYMLATQGITTSIRAGFDHLDTQLASTLRTYTSEVNAVSSTLGGLNETLTASHVASSALERTLRAKDGAEYTRLKDQLQSEQTLMLATARLTTSFEQVSPVLLALQKSPNLWVEALMDRQETLFGGWRTHQDEAETRLLQATLDTHARLEALLGAFGSLGDRVERSGQQQHTIAEHVEAGLKELVLLGNGLLQQVGEQTELAERQRAESGSARDALQNVLDQNRELALTLTRLLEALPAQLKTAELAQSQTQLTNEIGRLLTGLEHPEFLVVPGSQPA